MDDLRLYEMLQSLEKEVKEIKDKMKELENKAEINRIYAGTEDYVEFFKTIIRTLGVEDILEYQVEDVNGELEIVIKGEI